MNPILNKILTGVVIAVIGSFLTWGIWVTCNSFAVEDIQKDVTKNSESIKKESKERTYQIEKRMDKQDEKMEKIYELLIKMNK